MAQPLTDQQLTEIREYVASGADAELADIPAQYRRYEGWLMTAHGHAAVLLAERDRLTAELEQARQQIAEVRDVCDQIDLELSGTIPPDDTTYGGLVTRVRNAAGFHPAAAGRSTATTEHALWGQLADALNAISAWGIDPLRGLADRLGGRKIVRLDPGEVDHHSGWTYQLKYRPVIEVDGVTPYGWEVEHRPTTAPAARPSA